MIKNYWYTLDHEARRVLMTEGEGALVQDMNYTYGNMISPVRHDDDGVVTQIVDYYGRSHNAVISNMAQTRFKNATHPTRWNLNEWYRCKDLPGLSKRSVINAQFVEKVGYKPFKVTKVSAGSDLTIEILYYTTTRCVETLYFSLNISELKFFELSQNAPSLALLELAEIEEAARQANLKKVNEVNTKHSKITAAAEAEKDFPEIRIVITSKEQARKAIEMLKGVL